MRKPARHQERFVNEDGVVIVATIAFGMGIRQTRCASWPIWMPKSIEARIGNRPRWRDVTCADAGWHAVSVIVVAAAHDR
jgi:hypothetical protein